MADEIEHTEPAYANLDLRAEHAATRDEAIRFVFDFPELLIAFELVDEKANSYKSGSRRAGLLTIAGVLVALLIAAAAPLLEVWTPQFGRAAAYVSAVFALCGTGLGLSSLLPWSDRRKWLHFRLQSESIRLFHFGFIAAQIPRIAGALDSADEREKYLAQRAASFSRLKSQMAAMKAKASRAAARELGGQIFAEATPVAAPASDGSITDALGRVFAAWRALRLERQLAYCNAKLETGLKSAVSNPLRQARAFAVAGWVCIAAVVGLHLLDLADNWLHPPTELLEVGVVWAALITLALRAAEGGLQSEREVERYEQYRAHITVAIERFDDGATLQSKTEVMRGFERSSLEEMRVFLRAHARSHFLL